MVTIMQSYNLFRAHGYTGKWTHSSSDLVSLGRIQCIMQRIFTKIYITKTSQNVWPNCHNCLNLAYNVVPNMNTMNHHIRWAITTNTHLWKNCHNYSNLEWSQHMQFYMHWQHITPDYCIKYEQNHILLWYTCTCMYHNKYF